MGLIVCPECGKQISDKSISCPNCGLPSQFYPSNVNPQEKSPLSGEPKPSLASPPPIDKQSLGNQLNKNETPPFTYFYSWTNDKLINLTPKTIESETDITTNDNNNASDKEQKKDHLCSFCGCPMIVYSEAPYITACSNPKCANYKPPFEQ